MSIKNIFDEVNFAEAILPVNLATAANDGDWVSMKNYQALAIIIFGGPGASAEPATITLEQALDVSGGSAKALNVTRYHKKQAAVNLQAVGTYTIVTQAAGASIALGSGADGDKAYIVGIWIKSEDLDVDNGFDCVRVRIADVGLTSQIGAGLYALCNPRFTPPPSGLTN